MGEDVKLGVVLPTREAAMTGRPEVEPLLEFAARAEDLGFDSVWAGDAPFARPRFEPLTLLAAVAARTRRVTLGTAILLPALRHPLLLAARTWTRTTANANPPSTRRSTTASPST
jgi:alkanesulfonate monooxygenase SsuD/methylene tetrahydromethanopterin reductase-like flavin-dependent oxidoreductase (luciferase family)